jgi:hypothetical protein
MNYNSKKPDESQVKRYIVERIVGKIFHLVRPVPDLAEMLQKKLENTR